jgi:hypothetical protein
MGRGPSPWSEPVLFGQPSCLISFRRLKSVAFAGPALTVSLNRSFLRATTLPRAFGFTLSTIRFVLPLAILTTRLVVAALPFFRSPCRVTRQAWPILAGHFALTNNRWPFRVAGATRLF